MDYINRLDNYDGPEIAKIVGIQDTFFLCSTAVLELCKFYSCWLWRMWEALGDPYGLYEEAGIRSAAKIDH